MLEHSQVATIDGPLTETEAILAVAELVSLRAGAAEAIRADTRLDELGLDSLDQADLLVTLEEIAGCELDPEPAAGFTVVGDLVSLRPVDRP